MPKPKHKAISFHDGKQFFRYTFPDDAPKLDKHTMGRLLRDIEGWSIRHQPIQLRAAQPGDNIVVVYLASNNGADIERLRVLYINRGGHQHVVASIKARFGLRGAPVQQA